MLLKRLIELRLKHDLTQEDVAKILNTARTTYNGYELGRSEMNYESLLILADYYKVSLDFLFGRSEQPFHTESYNAEEVEFMTRSLSLYNEIKKKY